MKKIIGIIIVLVCLFSIYSIAEEECEHEWIIEETTTIEELNETRTYYHCYKCDGFKYENYLNNCDHMWEIENIWADEYEITTDYLCSECNGFRQIRIKNNCVHEWKLDYEDVEEYIITKFYYCSKCNYQKTEEEENTCEHKWTLLEKQYNNNKLIYWYNCLLCEAYKNEEKENTCEHEWKINYIKIEDDCITYISYKCIKCYCISWDDNPISERKNIACNHNWILEYEESSKYDIYTIYICTMCEAHKGIYIKNNCEHNFEEIKTDKILSHNGEITIIYQCSKCKAEDWEYIKIECNHNWELINEYKWSEENIIYITKTYKCNICKYCKYEDIKEKNNCKHKYEIYAKSIDYDGSYKVHYNCIKCGNYYSLEEICTCNHDWIEAYRLYYYNGKQIEITYKCTKCNTYDHYNTKTIDNNCAHDKWTDWILNSYNDIQEENIYYRKCKTCGYEEYKQEKSIECKHKHTKCIDIFYSYEDDNRCQKQEKTICLDCNNIIQGKYNYYNHDYYHDICINCGHETEHTHNYEEVSSSVVWKTQEVVTKYKCFCGDTYNEHKSYSEYQQEEAASNSKEFVAPITGKPKLWVEFDDSECKTTHNCDCSNIEHEHDWELMYEEEDDNDNVVHIHYECTFSK